MRFEEEAVLLAFRMEEGAMGQGKHWTLEAENDTEMDFSLEPLEGTGSCQHLHFSQVKLTADF